MNRPTPGNRRPQSDADSTVPFGFNQILALRLSRVDHALLSLPGADKLVDFD